MTWCWELPDWPHFSYDKTILQPMENRFLQGMGGMFAIMKHLDGEKRKALIIEILSTEGEKSAEIEGELLQRESLQSSIQRHFGLLSDEKIPPKEKRMGDLIWKVYETYSHPLTHDTLHDWHGLLMEGSKEIEDIGRYRSHDNPMEVIAGRYDKKIVHFQAPPSYVVHKEMSRFIDWFNHAQLSPLERAAIGHLYFENIHPFEDGNGRIGRALVEKALSQSLKQPTLIAVSQVIHRRKKDYYKELDKCNRSLDINSWIVFFSEIILEAQEETLKFINFLMVESLIMNELQHTLNDRQHKVLLRLFQEGSAGFQDGLSAAHYISITKTSRPTATRDLNELVEQGALYKTGSLRHTRYWLNLDFPNQHK